MTRRSGNDPILARQRFLVIVILSLHLVFFAFSLFGVLLMMGYELERVQSFDGVATPYLILGWTCILAFILFVLTLIYFIRRKKKSRTFASIAGIGGYLVNLTLALIFDLETKAFSSQVMIFLSFVFPMVAVLSYYRMERSEEAT